MAVIKVNLETKTERQYEEVEIEFPLYTLSGYNGEETSNRSWTELKTSFEIHKIISPTEYMRLEKKSQKSDKSDDYVRYEFEHTFEKTPITGRRWFLQNPDDYDKKGSKEQWDILYADFQDYLAKLV
jgi:hypothetical protein